MTTSERLALGLIVIGVLSRLIPHPPNVTAVVGVSLLGAYAIRSPWLAALIPVAVMALADLVLGWHSSALFTYAGMLGGALIGRGLLHRLSLLRLGSAAFLASLLFFLVSNFGVYLGGYYGYGLDGLIACYVAAIPFWGLSLIGDLGSTAILFGLFVLAGRWTEGQGRALSPGEPRL
ncbi:DUF6580 family putative transport protein [Devosia sp. CN2-171]|uniref:DUF6580 family putative transport protein n=1 Tax=Devosia sp. CN2-171 TaxID=3400909 RepID=UPI003BF90AC5